MSSCIAYIVRWTNLNRVLFHVNTYISSLLKCRNERLARCSHRRLIRTSFLENLLVSVQQTASVCCQNLLVAILIGISASTVAAQVVGITNPLDAALNQGPKQEAVGERVMVATQLPSATNAALRVLREGGNAVDAAITATFVQNVVDYHQVSLFGAMTGLYYEAKTGRYYAFNAYGERPFAGRSTHGDPQKVSIAGKVRALEQLAKRFGTRSWRSYIEPAIQIANAGVVMTSFMYGINYYLWERDELLRNSEAARAFYMPDGHLVPVGRRWKMPQLAKTLRRVADEGADYLYTGEWAKKFVVEATKRGGRVSLEDLAEYEVMWLEPVRFTYRGYEIVTEPPPVAGGLVLGYNLNVLENFDLKDIGHYANSPETLEIIARTFGRVENEIRWAIGDPRSFNVPVNLWLSKEYGRMGAQFVRNSGVRVDMAASEVPAAFSVETIDPFRDDSNHNVIVDGDGNWITYLHTGHGGMPGVFIDGIKATGSSRWSQTSGAGRRFSTHVTATFVVKNDKPWMALGSPGSPSMPVTEVLISMFDFGMKPQEAVDAPRFWAYRDRGQERDFGNVVFLQIESRLSPSLRSALASRGVRIQDLGPYNWHTGSIQLVWRDGAGKLHGVTDPRRLGNVAGF